MVNAKVTLLDRKTKLRMRIVHRNVIPITCDVIFERIRFTISVYVMATTTKPERLRFTSGDDLVLLREVISQNPYEDKEKWRTVADRVKIATQKDYSLRAIRDHVEHLLKNWIKTNRANLKK